MNDVMNGTGEDDDCKYFLLSNAHIWKVSKGHCSQKGKKVTQHILIWTKLFECVETGDSPYLCLTTLNWLQQFLL